MIKKTVHAINITTCFFFTFFKVRAMLDNLYLLLFANISHIYYPLISEICFSSKPL